MEGAAGVTPKVKKRDEMDICSPSLRMAQFLHGDGRKKGCLFSLNCRNVLKKRGGLRRRGVNPSVASPHFCLNIFLSASSSSVLSYSLPVCVFNAAANKKRCTKGL